MASDRRKPGTGIRSWPRLARRTVRLRLTLIYGCLFLLAGIGLLAITYLLVSHATGNLSVTRRPSGGLAITTRGGGVVALLPGADPRFPSPQQIRFVIAQAHAAEVHQLVVQSGIALAVMTVLSIGLGWVIAGRVLRPLRTMTSSVRNISAANLRERLALSGPDDELKELGDTFDGLLERLEGSFEAQRQFVANASHELRTPLARQRTVGEIALRDPRPTIESLRASHERVLAAGEQQERLIEALLTLAQGERRLDRPEPVDLAVVAGDVLLARRTEAEHRGLRMGSALGAAPTWGDPHLVERLVANLVDNAIHHNVAGGRVEAVTGTREDRAVLSVANTGPVVRPEEVERLFEPFRRLGPDRTDHGEGFGLGLSIVRAIATAHDATLVARAHPAGGLNVEVAFPASMPRAPHTGETARARGPSRVRHVDPAV